MRAWLLVIAAAGCASDDASLPPNVHIDGWGRWLELDGDVTDVQRLEDGRYEARVDGTATITWIDHWMFDHQEGTFTTILEDVTAGDEIVFGRDPAAQSPPANVPCRVDRAGMAPDRAAVDASLIERAPTVSVYRGGAWDPAAGLRAWHITCDTLTWDQLRPVVTNSNLSWP